MATHTIDLSGDVTLVLKIPSTHFAPLPKTPDAANPQTITGGSEAKPEVRIKVSGKHLSMASPMFERIISGNSKERVQTNGTPSVEIYVEGLDLEVFLILMNILHYKPQELPAQASVELVAKLGILADYYECVSVVRFYAVNWMTPTLMEMVPSTIGDTCMRDLMVRLWISWIFDLPEAFKYYSETLVQNSRGSIGLLGLPMPGRIISGFGFTVRLPGILTR